MQLLQLIKFLEGVILDGFFSKRCVGCGIEGSWLCLKCQEEAYKGQCSAVVKTEVDENVWIGFNFENNIVREMIHYLKYNGVIEIAELIIKILSENVVEFLNEEVFLIPIPLTSIKMKRRGYNQTELIGSALKNRFSLVMDSDFLWRINQNSSQVGLGKDSRMVNLNGNFILNPKKLSFYVDKKIILLDDVCTTGSTMKICADLFRSHGIDVRCFALAKSL